MALNQTMLGKEIIPVELVGQNIEYKILKEPFDAAHPKGDEMHYSDDYMLKLNAMYPLHDILESRMEEIAKGHRLSPYINNVVIKKHPFIPTIHGRVILEVLLMLSADAKQWQPYFFDISNSKKQGEIRSAQDYLNRIDKIDSHYCINNEDGLLFCGIAVAKHSNLILPLAYENKVVILPSQSFVEHIAKPQMHY